MRVSGFACLALTGTNHVCSKRQLRTIEDLLRSNPTLCPHVSGIADPRHSLLISAHPMISPNILPLPVATRKPIVNIVSTTVTNNIISTITTTVTRLARFN